MSKTIFTFLSVLLTGFSFAQTTVNCGWPVRCVKIGTTFYDLQTTASVGRQISLDEDGNVVAFWCHRDSSIYANRVFGIGVNSRFNYTWGVNTVIKEQKITLDAPTTGYFNDGSSFVASSTSNNEGLYIYRNTDSQSLDWVLDSVNHFSNITGELRWSRTINVGDTMYTIGNLISTQVNGVLNPIVFGRSVNRGKSWTSLIVLPGYDSVRYAKGARDTYTIDARDSLVAIVIGGAFKDVTLFKSYDYGVTWQSRIIDSFALPRFVWGRDFIDPANPVTTNDGSLDILIDNNGDVHVSAGRLSYSDDDTTDDLARSGSYFNLYHWSENQPTWKICGTPIDMDGQPGPSGAPYDITEETTNTIDSFGNPSYGLSYAARYGMTSISTHPSLSVDKYNNIFVTWDAPVELTYNDFLANYRDVHVSFSLDNGKTWANSQNVTKQRSKEAVFASMAKHSDDSVHLIFQVDNHPGTHWRSQVNVKFHPNDVNDIYFAAISVKDILDSAIGTIGVESIPESRVFAVKQNQPNPFSENTKVVIYLRAGSDLTCTVTDLTGKVVSTQNMGYKGAGHHDIIINGDDLTSGIYTYTLRTRDSEVTKKMQVVD